jgi:hypothetical protein
MVGIDMSSPIAPVVALGVTSYANQWYNTGNALDVKPLLFAGVAGLILELVAAIPGAEPVASGIGWLAFVGFLLSPVQNPSPVQNLLKISGGSNG